MCYNLWFIIVCYSKNYPEGAALVPTTNKSASKQVQSYACVDFAEREQIQQTNVC